MAKSEEWVQENQYDMEIGSSGELILVRTDTDLPIELKKETLPSNSATKQILKDLEEKG